MVAPVCEQNVTGRVVYFPERMKQLIFKNGIVEEGKVYEKGFSYVEMPMGTVHVFLREGYLFPAAKGGKCVEDVDFEEPDNAHRSHPQISPHGRNDTPPVSWFLLPNDSVKVV